MGERESRLTPKQAIFAREVALHGNATHAAKMAGCPPLSAHVTGARWLRNAKVAAAIAAERARLGEKYEITARRTLGRLAQIAYGDCIELLDEEGKVLPVQRMSEAARAAIAGLEVESSDGPGRVRTITHKVKIADRIRALELLGKHQKLFSDQVELGGIGGGPIDQTLTVTFVRPG